jgi:uncharacterized protein (DUF1800 family)
MKSIAVSQRQDVQKALNQLQNSQIDELRAWWLVSLIRTGNPLGARMTLFWQNHFTSQQRKVRHAPLLYRQQATLMRHATGQFGKLLNQMLRDPALLIYLDNRANRRNRPNENLARELLELFALGEGNYQEKDVRELARALTGMTLDRDLQYVFRKAQHDPGEKNLLGTRGDLAADDVVDILLTQPATAVHLVRKLWRHFISPHPDSQRVDEWSRLYRESGYDLQQLLGVMFSSKAFTDPSVHGQLIKSPVELIVGTHRLMGVPPVEDISLLRACRDMQQNLYEPPNVRGWLGGTHWINSHTLLARRRFINRMLRSDVVDFSTLQNGLDPAIITAALLPLQLDTGDTKNGTALIRDALRSPAYQLY